jgi:hypothetical protein
MGRGRRFGKSRESGSGHSIPVDQRVCVQQGIASTAPKGRSGVIAPNQDVFDQQIIKACLFLRQKLTTHTFN